MKLLRTQSAVRLLRMTSALRPITASLPRRWESSVAKPEFTPRPVIPSPVSPARSPDYDAPIDKATSYVLSHLIVRDQF